MYRAKRSGRSRFELFDQGSRERAMRRLELEAALRRAIERDELVVHYQPRFSLGERPPVDGLEALVRWQPPGARPDRARRLHRRWPRRPG